MQELDRHNISFTGTCNKNRKELPDKIRCLGIMEGGEVIPDRPNRLLTLVWQETKWKVPVIVVSIAASAGVTTVISRNHHVPPTMKPVIVV